MKPLFLAVGIVALSAVGSAGVVHAPTLLQAQAGTSLQTEVINATVRVDGKYGSGSGTFISPTRLLTNHHVVAAALVRDGGKVTIRGWVIEGVTLYPVTYAGKVIHHDRDVDLAMVEITGSWAGAVAKLSDDNPRQGDTVIKSGAAHGGRVKITEGWWQFIDDGELGQRHAHHSAPSIGGDSGGGVWTQTRDGWRLVAVTRAIQAMHGMPVSTSALAVPLDVVKAFIADAADASAPA